jgi:hypothetical protein
VPDRGLSSAVLGAAGAWLSAVGRCTFSYDRLTVATLHGKRETVRYVYSLSAICYSLLSFFVKPLKSVRSRFHILRNQPAIRLFIDAKLAIRKEPLKVGATDDASPVFPTAVHALTVLYLSFRNPTGFSESSL